MASSDFSRPIDMNALGCSNDVCQSLDYPARIEVRSRFGDALSLIDLDDDRAQSLLRAYHVESPAWLSHYLSPIVAHPRISLPSVVTVSLPISVPEIPEPCWLIYLRLFRSIPPHLRLPDEPEALDPPLGL